MSACTRKYPANNFPQTQGINDNSGKFNLKENFNFLRISGLDLDNPLFERAF